MTALPPLSGPSWPTDAPWPPGVPVPDDIVDALAVGGTWTYRHLTGWRDDAIEAEIRLLACVVGPRADTWALVSAIVDEECFTRPARARLWTWLAATHAAGTPVRDIDHQDRLLACLGNAHATDPVPVAVVAVAVRLNHLARLVGTAADQLARDPHDTTVLDRLAQLRADVADWEDFRRDLLAPPQREEAAPPCAPPPHSPDPDTAHDPQEYPMSA